MTQKLLQNFILLYLFTLPLYSNTAKDTLSHKPAHAGSPAITLAQHKALSVLDKAFPMAISPQTFTHPEFTHQALQREYPINKNILEDRQRVAAMFTAIEKENRWVDTFSNEAIQSLPVGIKYSDQEGGMAIELGLMNAMVNTRYISFTAFARITLPQTDDDGKRLQLFFGSDNLKISHQGGIVGDARLILMGDTHIPFDNGAWLLSFKGGFDYRNGNTQNITYAKIDCNGLKEIAIQGEIQCSRDKVLPADENGKLLPATRTYSTAEGTPLQIPNRVRGDFTLITSDWNDIFTEISLSPFVLTTAPDKFLFSVNTAILDFSDTRTPNIPFPEYYHDNGLLFPSVESWRGVYVESLQIGLPEAFKTKQSITENKRISFEAHHMIMDNYGVSGLFSVENLVPLSQGRTNAHNAWAMAIDQIGIELAAGTLIGATLAGRVELPIAAPVQHHSTNSNPQNNTLGIHYQGFITEQEYAIYLSALDTLNIPYWNAKAQLHPNSTIELNVENNTFKPRAILNGNLSIATNLKESSIGEHNPNSSEKKLINIEKIAFQELILQTEAPIIQVGAFGYEGEISLLNFPVSISNIALNATGRQTRLTFDLSLNLMDSDAKGFAAKTRLNVLGTIEEHQYRQRWRLDKVKLDDMLINADLGGFKMNGFLSVMRDDPQYGDGFSADVTLELAALDGLLIQSSAIFGKKDFRYWYVDALVDNLPSGASPLIGLKGFGGGAFYQMKRKGFSAAFSSAHSPSGLTYTPDKSSGLGLKAMVLFSIVNDKAINGGAGFEILFNKTGGLNRMGLYGEAHIMQALTIENPAATITGKLKDIADDTGLTDVTNDLAGNKLTKPFVAMAKEHYNANISGKVGFNAYIGIEYDFQNKILHGEADTYVNVVGGAIQGRASGGRAGWAVLHLEKDFWYFHMGTPQDRLGLNIGIGPLHMESGGYFMIGDYMPPSPPPPPEVAQILGVEAETLHYMRDENALGTGRGFAFGQDFKVDTGDLRFLMFYARFVAGGGYDIMLRDYGQAKCVNTGDQVGINGWYANGQAYAYLQGELGIRIKLFFVRKKIPIIKGGAAVLLQAKAPNPIWMRGYVGGYYNLLGGLVKGKFRFKVTLGEECEFADEAPLGGIKMIADLSPKEGASEVDVFTAPRATFSMPIGTPIIIPEDQADKTYKIILEKFRVVDTNGNEVPGTLEWSYMNDSATFLSEDILPPDTALKVEVSLSFQEKTNGVFTPITIDGEQAIETEARHFTTAEAPNHIPLHNLQYSYPVVQQQQFYSDEYPNGYVQLKRGQDYLFEDPQWKSEVRIIAENGQTTRTAFSYDYGKNQIYYQIPSLKKETSYTCAIVSFPKNAANTSTYDTNTEVTTLNEDNTFEITTKTAANLSKDGVIERLSYSFITSPYTTFSEKINHIKVNNNSWGRITSDVIYLTCGIKDHDGFEYIELQGNQYTDYKPLVVAASALKDSYFTTDINPILYAQYPIGAAYTLSRNTEPYGYIPKRALPLVGGYLESMMHNTGTRWRRTTFPFRYNLPDWYRIDFSDIYHQVLNDVVEGIIPSGTDLTAILNHEFPFMRYGIYTITLQYILPGGTKGTTAVFTYKNPLQDR